MVSQGTQNLVLMVNFGNVWSGRAGTGLFVGTLRCFVRSAPEFGFGFCPGLRSPLSSTARLASGAIGKRSSRPTSFQSRVKFVTANNANPFSCGGGVGNRLRTFAEHVQHHELAPAARLADGSGQPLRSLLQKHAHYGFLRLHSLRY